MELLEKIDQVITISFKWIITSLFTIATLLYTLQMVLRIGFAKSIFWIDPTIGYFFTISALYGAAIASKTDENIKIDILKKYSHLKPIKFINLSFSLFVTLAIIAVFVGHFRVELSAYQDNFISAFLDIPYIILFIGSGFFLFKNLVVTFKNPSTTDTQPPIN